MLFSTLASETSTSRRSNKRVFSGRISSFLANSLIKSTNSPESNQMPLQRGQISSTSDLVLILLSLCEQDGQFIPLRISQVVRQYNLQRSPATPEPDKLVCQSKARSVYCDSIYAPEHLRCPRHSSSHLVPYPVARLRTNCSIATFACVWPVLIS